MKDNLNSFYLSTSHGNLFCTQYNASSGSNHTVIFLQPFAEELNASRRQISQFSRILSNTCPINVLVIDFFGTGDSEGEFCEATLSIWKSNLNSVIDHLIQQNCLKITLMGARLGGLLAIHWNSLNPIISNVLLWDPYLSGRQAIDDFFSIRVAASLFSGKQRERISDIHSIAENKGTVEVAGYILNQTIIKEFSQLEFPDSTPEIPCTIIDCEKDRDQTFTDHKYSAIHYLFVNSPHYWKTGINTLSTLLIDTSIDLFAKEINKEKETNSAIINDHLSKTSTQAEEAVFFDCNKTRLSGVLHHADSQKIIIYISGAPQTRVGSHALFIQLARNLAKTGIASLRFDYRGSGDSPGEPRTYYKLSDDIDAAISYIKNHHQYTKINLLGLCDGATACVLNSDHSANIEKLLLLNPWLDDINMQPQTALRHYYYKRFITKAFWTKLFSGKMNILISIKEIGEKVFKLISPSADIQDDTLHKQLSKSFSNFKGSILFLFSGNDVTGMHFRDALKTRSISIQDDQEVNEIIIVKADHTFSKAEWRDQLVTLIKNELTRS